MAALSRHGNMEPRGSTGTGGRMPCAMCNCKDCNGSLLSGVGAMGATGGTTCGLG